MIGIGGFGVRGVDCLGEAVDQEFRTTLCLMIIVVLIYVSSSSSLSF